MFIQKATPGIWPSRGEWVDGRHTSDSRVMLSCPECGDLGELIGPEGTHEIDGSGNVSPSVVCECGFHEFVTLDNYSEPVDGSETDD